MKKKVLSILIIVGVLISIFPFVVSFLVNNGYTKEESKIEIQKDFSNEKKDINIKINNLITK